MPEPVLNMAIATHFLRYKTNIEQHNLRAMEEVITSITTSWIGMEATRRRRLEQFSIVFPTVRYGTGASLCKRTLPDEGESVSNGKPATGKL